MLNLDLLKKEFKPELHYYFNSAALGPSPNSAQEKAQLALQWEGNPAHYDFEMWEKRPDLVREQLAQLLGAKADQIAHGTSVTDFVSLVAQMYPLKDDDVVVSMEGDYPSLVLPWMVAQETRSFQFQVLRQDLFFDPELLAQNLPKNTRVLNISQTMFNTGRDLDIEALGQICKDRNIFYIVDGTQSFGGASLSLEVLSLIDIYTCSTYKWMLGVYGHAFAYFSERALLEIPRMTGNWLAAPTSKDLNCLLDYTLESLPGARKFDRGQTPNALVLSALEGALEVLQSLQLTEIQKHNRKLADYFYQHIPREHCKVVTPERFGNIVCFELSDEKLERLNDLISEVGISVSFREGAVRSSFHAFNRLEHVKEYVGVLQSL